MDSWYFCPFLTLFVCTAPVDPAVPPELNSGWGITYFGKWKGYVWIRFGCRLPATKEKHKII